MTYSETPSTNSGNVLVSSSGQVTTAASLPVGTYEVTGTMNDGSGDTGTWSYTLYVTGGVITETHKAGSVDAGSTFTDTITTSGNDGPVTFVTTSGSAFTVSAAGAVSAPATLTPGDYVVSGTDSDAFGNAGTWSYTLTVNPPVQVAQATLTIVPGQVTLVSDDANLSTTGGSGSGLVTFKVVGGTAKGCTISGSSSFVMTASTAGTCIVQATKLGDLYYLAATSADVTFRFQAPEAFKVTSAKGGVRSGSSSVVTLTGTGLSTARIISASGAAVSIILHSDHALRLRLVIRATAKPGRYEIVVGSSGSDRRIYFTLSSVVGSSSLKGHVSLTPQVLTTKVAQAQLSIVPGHAKVGSSVVVQTTGGSGSGALSLRLVGGTAKGCALNGTSVRATSAGTCVVVATKAGDAHHRSTSSPAATLTFVATSAFEVTSVSGTLAAGATSNIVLRGNDFLAGGKVTVSNKAFTWHVISGNTKELTIQIVVAATVSPGVYVLTLESKAGGIATVYLVMSKTSGKVTGRASLTS